MLQILRDHRNDYSQFLSCEGHFAIYAEIRIKSTAVVDVRLLCYRHSIRGGKAIEKIRNTLMGEVCRMNRKWRKIRERSNQ